MRTGRSQAFFVAASPALVRSRNSLLIYPERWPGSADPVDIEAPPLGATPPGLAFNTLLTDTGARYGADTAAGVGLVFEYPAN